MEVAQFGLLLCQWEQKEWDFQKLKNKIHNHQLPKRQIKQLFKMSSHKEK